MISKEIEKQPVPENLAQHPLIMQIKEQYDAAWQELILPFLGFLLQHQQTKQAEYLVAFVKDMRDFTDARALVAHYLREALWSEKIGTNLANQETQFTAIHFFLSAHCNRGSSALH